MARSQNTFMKKQREKKRQKKKEDKVQRKQERQENSSGGSLDAMIAYVDEFGNITDTPPEESKEEKTDEKEEA
ncbi:cold-shock protein [uncultured Pontibacter sp.]|uniref:cold-shock protein n=1 Tax=uncultured Pontibacter sp. TaxID=453356 RepID=UPI0026314836|nr:cold-shock protein [uncultured Pontibacter sp.]